MTAAAEVSPLSVLTDLFGDNRAEWPPERFRELFVQPSYFTKLETKRPTLLIGGRGTGKTTSLRSLRFDATHERLHAQGLTLSDQAHFGIFIRINKNHVRAFKGGGLAADEWNKAFAHYFNLLVCDELCTLAQWLEAKTDSTLGTDALRRIALDLGVAADAIGTLSSLDATIGEALSKLQLFVNNPRLDTQPLFSMAEVPLITFASALMEAHGLSDRVIFCCVDEYENLLDDQQAILNTYIKHACPPISYKIGVRQNGLRTHCTIDGNDLLSTPDDFRQIDIVEEGFDHFAHEVARLRLQRAKERGLAVPAELGSFLQELPFAREAAELGADRIAEEVLERLRSSDELFRAFSSKPSAETYFLKYWADSEKSDVRDLAADWIAHPEQWVNRLNNYGYASLFWLAKGRKGVRIRKHYSGARTLLALAAGNIRYFLELIDAAISSEEALVHLGGELQISAKAQTLGARLVGQRRLNQLEGLAEHGVELKRLILAIGKVFFELAREPLGRTPEVTSFVLSGSDDDVRRITDLLQEGVAHLAIEVAPRTKPTSQFELRDDEFRLHPIFCAFFEISHRRKRRSVMAASELLAVLGDQPGKAISTILGDAKQSPSEDLPNQLALFTTFFDSGNA